MRGQKDVLTINSRVHTIIFSGFAFLLAWCGPRCALAGPEAAQKRPFIENGTVDSTSEKTVVFIGDSLTEGYGVQRSEAFPEVVGGLLTEKGHRIKVINGGISGSVSADADRRVRWYLKSKPSLIVIELGGNDALKGTPIATIKSNLGRAIDVAKEFKVPVLLCSVPIYTNMGAAYSSGFAKMFKELASEKKVPLWQMPLEKIILDKETSQADHKHPNTKGHALIAEDLAKVLTKELEKRP